MSESKGLGDTVEKVLEQTGVAKAVKKVFGKRCGCQKRKEKLNELVPYGPTKKPK
jgi:hypothetical protein